MEAEAGNFAVLLAEESVERLAGGQGDNAAGVPELTRPTASSSAAATEARLDRPAAAAKTAKTLEKPEKTVAGKKSPKPSKKKRESHPRTTKACRCDDRDHCDHACFLTQACTHANAARGHCPNTKQR